MPRSDVSPVDDGVLECDGVFRMRVPVGWRVRGIQGVRYDLADDEVDLRVTVSVARTGDRPVEATAAVLAFARREGAQGDLVPLEPGSADGAERAFLRFATAGRDWAAVVMPARGCLVLASASAAAGDRAALDVGEQMLASLGPSVVRARWRRRHA